MRVDIHTTAFGVALAAVLTVAPLAGQGAPRPAAPTAALLELTSPGFKDGGTLPDKYSCVAQPKGVSPPLQWRNAPKDTVSFVVLAHDLDSGRGKRFEDLTHWLLWNIPGSATQLPEVVPTDAQLPDGTHQMIVTQAANTIGFRVPCAPPAPGVPHHYVFELMALDQKLELPADAGRADVVKAIDGHLLAHATLIGMFQRSTP